MSKQHVFAAIAIVDGITATEKLILISLANRADTGGSCYPSYETIARDSVSSVRTACRGIKSLIDKGFIVKETRSLQSGYQTSNRYTVNIDRLLAGPDRVTSTGDTVANETVYNKGLVSQSDTPKLVAHKSMAALAG